MTIYIYLNTDFSSHCPQISLGVLACVVAAVNAFYPGRPFGFPGRRMGFPGRFPGRHLPFPAHRGISYDRPQINLIVHTPREMPYHNTGYTQRDYHIMNEISPDERLGVGAFDYY